MGKTIRQVVTFAATPHAVYELLMASEKHSALTGSAASISREIGGVIMAYDGYVDGKNIDLVPDRLIVQSWRASDWPEGFVSTVTFAFTPRKGGTEMVFTQTGVPDVQVDAIRKGWIDFYWKPMHKAIGAKSPRKKSRKEGAAKSMGRATKRAVRTKSRKPGTPRRKK